jgi:serine/threonine protein kinase
VVPKEVALLHNLKQECIIKLLDFFENQGTFYIVMERPEKYIDLFEYISRKGTVSDRSARYMCV